MIDSPRCLHLFDLFSLSSLSSLIVIVGIQCCSCQIVELVPKNVLMKSKVNATKKNIQQTSFEPFFLVIPLVPHRHSVL